MVQLNPIHVFDAEKDNNNNKNSSTIRRKILIDISVHVLFSVVAYGSQSPSQPFLSRHVTLLARNALPQHEEEEQDIGEERCVTRNGWNGDYMEIDQSINYKININIILC